ncbi:MAG: XdhC family protein [Ktedonobacterales bacterium]
MQLDILNEAQRLRSERRPFALATVVAAKQPASGTPGARAIILADGEIEGWIGGNCAQPTVIAQGLAALADGVPRLVVLRPDALTETPAVPGLVEVPMLCASGGELQIFVEPFLPKIELAVIGGSPVAQALVRLGAVLDFDVWACDPSANMETFSDASQLIADLPALRAQLGTHSYVVAATLNTYDEDAVKAALESNASYVGVVASRKRFSDLQKYLRKQGFKEDQVARLKRPYGVPGAGLHPGEIAFSVMAELLEARHRHVGIVTDLPSVRRAEATDPVCGMKVDIATARYRSERAGQTFYFCCAGCQASFETP